MPPVYKLGTTLTSLDDLVPLSYWVDAEMFGAIIFASLPALRQLYTHYKQHKTLSRIKTSPYRGSSDATSSGNQARKFSCQKSIRTGADSGAIRMQSLRNGEIGRQKDVYIELNDAESGRNRRYGSQGNTSGQDSSLDDLRGHAACM